MNARIERAASGYSGAREVIIKLREQYLELAGKEAIWSKSYDRDHVATTLLRNQMMELRRNIADEMGKFAESYKNDYEIARASSLAGYSAISDLKRLMLACVSAVAVLGILHPTARRAPHGPFS
jgi:uncharacterized protein involved in exopolysaccharide biosynthesis